MAEDDNSELLGILRSVRAKHNSQPAQLAPQRDLARYSSMWQEDRAKDWRIRRLWLATAHCLGASFGQLAAMQQVNRSSVIQAVSKELPVGIRKQARLQTTAGYTEILHYQEQFVEAKEQLSQRSPQEAAQWLLNNHPYQGD